MGIYICLKKNIIEKINMNLTQYNKCYRNIKIHMFIFKVYIFLLSYLDFIFWGGMFLTDLGAIRLLHLGWDMIKLHLSFYRGPVYPDLLVTVFVYSLPPSISLTHSIGVKGEVSVCFC